VQISTVVDTHLRVDGNLLGHDLAGQIFDELTTLNPDWVEAKKRDAWDLDDIPKWIILGELGTGTATNGDEVVMPRGYAIEYKLLLREHGHTVRWIDHRRWRRGTAFGVKEFSYRDHQPAAVKAIIRHQQGIYEAPTGSGKSTVGCAVIWKTRPRKAHILVDKLELVKQWKRMLVQHAGVPEDMIGQIGGGKWDERRITICTVQTLRKRQPPQSFYDDIDLMILDECHHVTAETLMQLVQRYRARIRIGMSAAPDRDDGKFGIALDILGDVFYADAEDELREAGIIIAPKVYRIRTGFKYPYWGDHHSDKDGNCQVPGCTKIKKHAHRNNYQKLKTALVRNKSRNLLVASCVLAQAKTGDHLHIIISDEVRHLDEIEKILSGSGNGAVKLDTPPLYRLTGRMTKKQREAALGAFSSSRNAILLTTVGREGLDVPSIDRVYLPFPGKQPAATEQKIGRGTRATEGKEDCYIFDFADLEIPVLKHQFKNRANKVYRKLGLDVVL
jgi:superfamily II DNA or RNA helicase